MVLSDKDLRLLAETQGLIKPFKPENCEGATINLTLGPIIKKFTYTGQLILGEKLSEEMYETINIQEEMFLLNAGESVLVHSVETFEIPNDMIGIILEKYSLKLTGLVVSPASYMNPGYEGNMTFLATNHSSVPIQLIAGFKFCQLIIQQLTSEAEKPYKLQNQVYMGSKDVTISKMHLDKEIQTFLKTNGVENISIETSKELGDYLMEQINDAAEEIANIMKKEIGGSIA